MRSIVASTLVLTLAASALGVTNNSRLAALDSSGNLVSAAEAISPSGVHVLRVVKRTPTGGFVWSKDFNPTPTITNESETPVQLKIDSADNVYVAGTHNGSGSQFYFLVKYSAAGVKQWDQGYGGPNDNVLTGLALDTFDCPYIVGWKLYSGTGITGKIIRYSPSGTLVYDNSVRLNNLDTVFGGIAIDASNRIFVAAKSVASGGMTPPYNTAIVRYDRSLTEQWHEVQAAPANYNNYIAADMRMTIDGSGRPVATYTCYDFVNNRNGALVRKNSPGGVSLWSTLVAGSGFDGRGGSIVDSAGDVVVGGTDAATLSGSRTAFRLAKLSGTTGAQMWTSSATVSDAASSAVAENASGEYLLVGDNYDTVAAVRRLSIARFSAAGTPLTGFIVTATSVNRGDSVIPTATAGEFYVGGQVTDSSGGKYPLLAKIYNSYSNYWQWYQTTGTP